VSAAAALVAVDGPDDAPEARATLLRSLGALAPLFAAAIAFGVAAVIVAPYPAGIFHDDGVYLILAKSLASGSGYRYLHLPGTPIATHYPPVYPVLLALLWKLGPGFPANLTTILLANAALLGVVAFGFTRFVNRITGWPPLAAAALAAVGTLSLPMILLASLVMSEVLFLALLIPVLAACERAVGPERPRTTDLVLGGALGALALVRMQGVVLVIALALVLIARREWRRAALAAAGAAIVLAPWQLWVAANDAALPSALRGSYGSYLGWFTAGFADGGMSLITQTFTKNIGECAALLADRFAPWAPGVWRVLPILLAVMCFAGGAIRLRRRAPVTVMFVLAYVALTLVWPYTPWRFLWGVWPLVLFFVASGAVAVVQWRPSSPRLTIVRLAAALGVLVLGVGLARVEVSAYRAHAWSQPAQDATRRIAPAMRWIAHNARLHEAVIADAEPLVYLFTERPAIPPVAFTAREYVVSRRLAADTAALSELVRHSPVRYVVTVVPTTAAAARALSIPTPGRGFLLRQADTVSGGAVFAVERQ
jgi:hypothetical protein